MEKESTLRASIIMTMQSNVILLKVLNNLTVAMMKSMMSDSDPNMTTQRRNDSMPGDTPVKSKSIVLDISCFEYYNISIFILL